MKRLLLLLVTISFIAGPEPVSVFRLDPSVETAEARPGGRAGGMRGGGRASAGMRTGGARMSMGRPGVSRPSSGQPGGERYGGVSPTRPSTLPARPSLPAGPAQPVAGADAGSRPGTLPARPARPIGSDRIPSRPADGTRPGVRPPIAGAPRPSHPIALPPGSRPPGYRPPGWRPPEWRPPAYRPPYPRPPHDYWGDYYWWPEWGWYFTAAIAGSTLVYVATLPEEECEEVTYQGERLYLCDGVLYRATIHKDEPVYEIVTEPDEVIAAEGVSVGAFQDDRPLMLTSPRVQGPRVLDLQQALVDRGYDLGAIDGVFGPATERAVRAFQRDTGLEESGVVDEPTRESLAL